MGLSEVEGGVVEQARSWGGRRWPKAFVLLLGLAACGGNSPPVLSSQDVVVLQGLPEAITVGSVDPDGDPLTFTVTRPPAHGALSGVAPALTYTAASDYEGPDGFEVSASDGLASATAELSLRVLPVRGPSTENAAALDRLFLPLVRKLSQGGLAVAAAKGGKVVFARGYGHAAREVPMGPNPRSRIVSISKMVTMAAVMHLVELGTLHLDDRLLALLPDLSPPLDPRASAITLRNLLEHSAGLPADSPGGSLFWTRSTLGTEAPCADKVRQALAFALEAAPGERYQYSNMGFCMLSTVLERVTGRDYQRYVRDEVLAPMGIHGFRFAARAREDRPLDEVAYFDPYSCGDTTRDQCRVLTTTGGAAAWSATTVDLVRLLEGLHGGFLRPETLALVTAPSARDPTYGLGMDLQVRPGGTWTGHAGILDLGTLIYAFRRDDGWAWSLVVNANARGEFTVLAPAFTPAIALLDAGVDFSVQFPSVDLGPYDGQ